MRVARMTRVALVVLALVARVVVAENAVTCGSALKLEHASTKHLLTSQAVAYASGSGQQSVTAVRKSGEDAYWALHPALGETCVRGEAVAHGTTVRLQHVLTRAWLHSHLHKSPLSGQGEVSCFGSDESSDTGDHWVVELATGSGNWTRGKKVRFKHVDTGAYLHSHGMKYGRPIAGHQEVMAAPNSGANAMWTSEAGVYFGSESRDDVDEKGEL